MTLVHLIQHAEKEPVPGDPGLTARGHTQAEATARWLLGADVGAVYASPQRRAAETAAHIAQAAGTPVVPDERLRERLNWDGDRPFEEFAAEWERGFTDRDYAPLGGRSARQVAGEMEAFLRDRAGEGLSVAAVTHGGATVELLRTLVGDSALPDEIRHNGVPSCAITTIDTTARGLTVVAIASTTHLGAH